jgi:nucleosome binding factor SPN SPT16 subunit
LSKKRVGSLIKETHAGKLLTEWNNLLEKATVKPELVDMAPAVSAFMAVKDTEELVRFSHVKLDCSLVTKLRAENHTYSC